MSKIRKPHELSVETKIKALIYGQPGLGKTTLALSAPTPVLLDFDKGVHRVHPEHQTETLQVESWQDVLDVINDGSLVPFQTIVIDTASKMLDCMSLYLISKNPKLGKSNGALTLQGYGERKAEFNSFVKKLTSLGKHVIFVAHEKEEKNNKEDISFDTSKDQKTTSKEKSEVGSVLGLREETNKTVTNKSKEIDG
jgi:hypothetical protein